MKPLALTAMIGVLIALAVFALRPTYKGIRSGHADENYLGSQSCARCHTDHYASWARTYHSRMTQQASFNSVQGDFERDNQFEYLGIRARMEKLDNRFSMTLTFPDGREQTFLIDRTVGSRRIEQYLSKQNGQYIRLPLAYDLVNRRWMSLNGSFFYADSDKYFQHQTQWDGNCVFCHNVKAQPNFDPASRAFNTEVSELGIACGACHGPAANHADEAASPLVRTLWRMTGDQSKQIVNPSKLSPERSMMVCGHCHGQRVPEPISRIQTILGQGDPYNSGDDLSSYYRPVTKETTVGSYAFANRFWANGSPRLTAYEYQGLFRSRCFVEGDPKNKITCLSCHTMHEGDPKGQITEQNRTNKPCLNCHKEYESPAALALHTKHNGESAGSNCYACHMPRVVYGVMSVHPTHDITIPSPQLTASQAIPNACNQCHLDRSVNWSINETRRLWPDRYNSTSPSPDSQFDAPEGPRSLFAGNALTRALAAEAMSGGGSVKPDSQWAGPFLVEAFSDNYPIVRYFAANGLASGPWKYPKLDYLASLESRRASSAQWRSLFAQATQQKVSALAEQLRARRQDVDIEVGE